MKLTTTKIAELSLDPSNVRKHSRRNLDAIKASLRKFGQQKPIVVDAKGIVLAGNGTLTAAQELGWTEIQIVRTELAGVEATAFAIADNRTAELAEWDDNLGDVLQSLASDGYDLSQIGFDQSDLDALMGESESTDKKDVQIVSAIEVIAECENEDQQKLAYDLLTEKGLKCRLVTL
jgi:ParB-like chromosome segregation protein Spo0J